MIIDKTYPNLIAKSDSHYIINGDINSTSGNLVILLPGSLEVRGNILSQKSIFANCDIRASHTIAAGKDITVAGSLHTEDRVDTDGNIYAGKSIYASNGIYAGYDIFSGESITSMWEIEAERICAGEDVKARLPIDPNIELEVRGTVSCG